MSCHALSQSFLGKLAGSDTMTTKEIQIVCPKCKSETEFWRSASQFLNIKIRKGGDFETTVDDYQVDDPDQLICNLCQEEFSWGELKAQANAQVEANNEIYRQAKAQLKAGGQ